MSKIPTYFAPAERATAEELEEQIERVKRSSVNFQLLNKLKNFAIVVNSLRQIVFINDAFLQLLGLHDEGLIFGKRPGEVIGCINGSVSEGGCGTQKECRSCGAVNAILAALHGESDERDTRIRIGTGLKTLNLKTYSSLVEIEGEKFVLLVFTDTSADVSRRSIEKVFFHDILNLAGAVFSFSEMITEVSPREANHIVDIINTISDKLIDEILVQRQIALAEQSELVVAPETTSITKIINDSLKVYEHHSLIGICSLRYINPEEDIAISTDSGIVRRVLSILLKNALEDTRTGGKVTVLSKVEEGFAQIVVSNPGYIMPNVAYQIFQKSFSTKNANRGMGTYSAKLLTEKYLKGTLTFTSEKLSGTHFILSLPLNNLDN